MRRSSGRRKSSRIASSKPEYLRFRVPQIIYISIMLLVGYRIIQSYTQTMGTIQSVIDGSM